MSTARMLQLIGHAGKTCHRDLTGAQSTRYNGGRLTWPTWVTFISSPVGLYACDARLCIVLLLSRSPYLHAHIVMMLRDILSVSPRKLDEFGRNMHASG